MEKEKLKELQRKLETNEIKIEDLTDGELIKLNLLYEEQIEEQERQIEQYKQKFKKIIKEVKEINRKKKQNN